MNNKRFPCEIQNSQLKVCHSLGEMLDDQAKTKGLHELTFRDLRTWEITRTCIVSKHGELITIPFFFHFCPFCGTNISEHMQTEQDENENDAQ